jgi:hypothetical protein
MGKFVTFVAAIFTMMIVSPIGKYINDVVTTNYTFVNFAGNLSSIGWYVAYMRSYYWVVPLAVLVIFIILFFRKEEPEPYFPQMQQPRMPRMPRQPKPTRRTAPPKSKPPIFFGGGRA